MANFTVITPDAARTYDGTASYRIKDHGILHVTDEEGYLSIYSPSGWLSVEVSDLPGKPKSTGIFV